MSRGKNPKDWARRLGVSDQDVKMYLETFSMLDSNKDGLITPAELYNALKQLGCRASLEQATRMVRMADENGDGMVDASEYLSMILHSPLCLRPDVEAECLLTFKMFDRNNDGYISLEELRNTMTTVGQSLTNEEATAVLQEMDVNKDGRISYIEFIASWTDWLISADNLRNEARDRAAV